MLMKFYRNILLCVFFGIFISYLYFYSTGLPEGWKVSLEKGNISTQFVILNCSFSFFTLVSGPIFFVLHLIYMGKLMLSTAKRTGIEFQWTGSRSKKSIFNNSILTPEEIVFRKKALFFAALPACLIFVTMFIF